MDTISLCVDYRQIRTAQGIPEDDERDWDIAYAAVNTRRDIEMDIWRISVNLEPFFEHHLTEEQKAAKRRREAELAGIVLPPPPRQRKRRPVPPARRDSCTHPGAYPGKLDSRTDLHSSDLPGRIRV
jgi:hypothetical protein